MIRNMTDLILDASAAARRMNECGRRREPFLFLVDFLQEKPMVLTLEEANDCRILFDFNGKTNAPAISGTPPAPFFRKYPPDLDRYTRAFNVVRQNIRIGNTYLLNLTLPTRIETSLSLHQIFLYSKAKYRLLIPDRFVVFSPETFVQIAGEKIKSFPMKGTIDAAVEDAGPVLLNDPKEIAEHTTIVDLIRNDLSIVAKRVYVEEFRRLDLVRTNQKDLLQMSSVIVGTVPPDWRGAIGSLLFRLLPAGSVSGAPKRKTVEIILESEQYERGYYTGICGLFDGESLDSGVMIRYIENMNGELYYKSGGGITASSALMKEYQELIDKVYVPLI